MTEADEQQDYSNVPPQLRPHVFKKGQSGNPLGRPKGAVSLKEYARKMLEGMNEEEAMDFLEGLDKKVVWEMAEGKPDAKTELTGKDGGPIEINEISELSDAELIKLTNRSGKGAGKKRTSTKKV